MKHLLCPVALRLFRCPLLMVMCFLLYTCKKDDPLPQDTQTGQNTLGCLIDGKAYIPDGGGAFSGIKPVNGGFFVLQDKPYTLGVSIRTYMKDKQRLELYLNNYSLGKHPLNATTGTMPALTYPKDYGLYESSNGDEYVTTSKYTGWINLTKADTITGIIAGTFEFQAATKAGKVVNVTQGRFDVNYRTQ